MTQGEYAKLREQIFLIDNVFPSLFYYNLLILYKVLNRNRNWIK